MSDSQSAENFLNVSNFIFLYGDLILYVLMALGAAISINTMRISQGWRNYTLLILLMSILAYALMYVVCIFLWISGHDSSTTVFGAISSAVLFYAFAGLI